MKTRIFLVLLVVVSFSALSQSQQIQQKMQIPFLGKSSFGAYFSRVDVDIPQTITNKVWFLSGYYSSNIDSNLTKFDRTLDGEGNFGSYGETLFILGGWGFETIWCVQEYTPYMLTPDTVSIYGELYKEVNNTSGAYIYFAVQDSTGLYCFLGADNRVSSSSWQRFSWPMSYVKDAGIKTIYRIYLIFQIFASDSIYLGVGIKVRNLTFIYNTLGTQLVVDFGPTSTGVDGVVSIQQAPKGFTLDQNYPNPFNPSTEISFSLLYQEHITLKVYNVLGKEVSTLFNDEMVGAGNHKVFFDGSKLSSGTYFYRLTSSKHTETKKMMLMK